ncbi:hypothetical protein FE257_003742 [Aspergillus nanangensis]|uniref:Acetyl-CoA synthetase-like protein n=1 Tax=Aspergillus nanangensis TaxID=2582783 RepID=A0AAD4CBC5_ASPNN|nr:hypothetical protein FE257_003742 [Aspergillus nanangensis]
MPVFKSPYPTLNIPSTETIWEWIFELPNLRTRQGSPDRAGGYINTETKERLSYPQVQDVATSLSTALYHEHNLRAGDRVIIFSKNSIWYPVAMFAAIRLGAIASGASPFYTIDEMNHVLSVAQPSVIFTSTEGLPVALASAEANGISTRNVILLEGRVEGTRSLADLISAGKAWTPQRQVAAYRVPPGKTNGEICAFLGFSSGTTGLPKGVMLSHRNVIAQCLQLDQVSAPDLTRVLAALPFFHVTGLIHSLNFPAARNMEVAVMPQFTLEGMLAAVDEYKVEELLVVPPIIIRLVQASCVSQYNLSSLKRFFCGAAPLSKNVIAQLQQRFPHTGFKQGYGMTESCSAATLCPPELYSYANAHKCGVIVGNTELKIIDERGHELGVGEPGQILIRGPQVAMGYWQNPVATAETFDADGFLHSGDQGMLDERGLLVITDRLKELIKVNGVGVAPAELEDLLLNHAAVEDCGVASMPDDRAGERPQAFVVASGQPSRELGQQLMEYVQKHKTREKWVYAIRFVDAIPKSASGKILRRQLRLSQQQEGHPEGLVVTLQEARARL